MVCRTDVGGTAEYTGKDNNIRLVNLQTNNVQANPFLRV